MSKGSTRRKCQVSQETFADNWDGAFGKAALEAIAFNNKVEKAIAERTGNRNLTFGIPPISKDKP
jgi:hypothetical protein